MAEPHITLWWGVWARDVLNPACSIPSPSVGGSARLRTGPPGPCRTWFIVLHQSWLAGSGLEPETYVSYIGYSDQDGSSRTIVNMLYTDPA